MKQTTKDRINAIRSQLKTLRQPKLTKYSFDFEKIDKLEEELKQLLRDENS